MTPQPHPKLFFFFSFVYIFYRSSFVEQNIKKIFPFISMSFFKGISIFSKYSKVLKKGGKKKKKNAKILIQEKKKS